MNLISIILTSIFTNNIIFSRTLGLCPFLGISKRMKSALAMGLAVTFVMVISSLACYLIYNYALKPLSLEYLQIIVFILVIAFLVQVLDIILKQTSPPLYNALGIYLALITTNCAVLGTANDIVFSSYNLLQTLMSAFSTGIGFLLALLLMAGIRENLQSSNSVPKAFRGFAISLVAAAIMAMAFMGFLGI